MGRVRLRRRMPYRAVAALAFALGATSGSAAPFPSVAELVETADLGTLRVSPDGRLIVFRLERADIARNSYQLDWYVAELDGGVVRRVGGGGEPIFAGAGSLEPEDLVWSPDSRFIHYRALLDGGIGIWRAAADGSGARAVIAGEADVERIAATPDGSGLLYVLGPTRDAIARAEEAERDDGILVDAGTDIAQPLFRGGSVNGRPASERFIGRWVARAGLLWRAPRSELRLDLGSLQTSPQRQIAPELPAPLTVSLDQMREYPSAAGHVARLTLTSGQTRLEATRRGGGLLRCTAALCTSGRVGALLWRPGTDELLFTARDGHFRQTLALWDVKTDRVRRVAGGEGLLAGSRDWTEPCALTGPSLICVAAAATSPPRLVEIELASGRERTLFDPNAALRARPMPSVEQLSWALADGRIATATLLKPAAMPRGASLYVNYYYCPGFLRGGEGEDYPLAPLVEAGFVVACMNMVRFADASNGVGRYRDALEAVQGLVYRLGERGLIDRSRVGMGGFSAGSEATTWVLMNSNLLAAAGVASSQYTPSAYWATAMRGSSMPADLRRAQELGAPDETPERWRLISPALNVERIRAPLLMQLPEPEARMQMEFFAKLSHTATPVELHAFPGAAHIKMAPRQRFAVGVRNVDWFRYWLQDHRDPDPARAAQYRRWDELRVRVPSSARQ